MKLFISYSRDDKSYVYELTERIKDELHHDTWIDKRLIGGSAWWQSILDGIEQADAVVMFMTPKSMNSVYCKAELNYAQALKKPILPLMLKPVELPPALGPVQFVDIGNLTMDKALLSCSRALANIELHLDEYAPPLQPPRRPSVPDGDQSENPFEFFAAAEEANSEGDVTQAKKLFERVIELDPSGLGAAARERIETISQEKERQTAYDAIRRMAATPATLAGARAAWQSYVQKYGTAYDPDDLAATLNT